MGELKEIKFGREYTPSQLIDEISKVKDDFEFCIFLAVKKNGNQHMLTSTISQEEKCFLLKFFDAVVMKFFRLEPDNG